LATTIGIPGFGIPELQSLLITIHYLPSENQQKQHNFNYQNYIIFVCHIINDILQKNLAFKASSTITSKVSKADNANK